MPRRIALVAVGAALVAALALALINPVPAPAFIGVGLLAAVSILVGLRFSSLAITSGWAVVAFGVALNGVALFAIGASDLQVLVWARFGASLVLVSGLCLLLLERRATRDRIVFSQALALMIAGSAALTLLSSTGDFAAADLATSAVDLAVFVASFSLWATRPSRSVAGAFLTAGAALRLVGSSILVGQFLTSSAWVALAFACAGLLILGGAGLADDMEELGAPLVVPPSTGEPHRIAVPIIGLLAAPATAAALVAIDRPVSSLSIVAVALAAGIAGAILVTKLASVTANSRDELVATDRRNHDLAAYARDLVMVVNPDGLITSVAAAEHLLGRASGELLGERLADIVDTQDQSLVSGAFQAALSDERTEPFEARLIGEGNELHTFELRLARTSASSNIEGVIFTASTVRERKRLEADRAAAERNPRAISQLGEAALQGATPDELANKAVNLIVTNLDASACQLYRWQHEADVLLLEAAVGPGDGRVGDVTLTIGQSSFPGYVALTGESLQITDLKSERRFAENGDLTNGLMASGLGMPVQGANLPWGVLTITTRERREFLKGDIDFVHAIVYSLVLALDRRRAEDDTKHTALHDPLTRLPNRLLLMERLRKTLRRAKEDDSLFGVLFLDLDHFKWVNDNLGHDAGDQLLVEVGQRLQMCMRPGDTVARLGGDEFIVLCEDLESTSHASTIADRVTDAMLEPFNLGSHVTRISGSVGIALADQSHENAEALLRDADTAMYRAKELGRGRTEVFDFTMQTRVHERSELGLQLAGADERDELSLYYQPIVSLHTGRPVGTEALLRWIHPERGVLPPSEFLEVAERTGAASAFGRWVLRQACRDLERWQALPGSPFDMVSINLFSAQFSDPELAQFAAECASAAGTATDKIIMDVSEEILSQDIAASAQRVKTLREQGLRVAVDDFGSGSASLNLLHQLELDILKLDISVVHGLHTDRTRRIAESIVLAGVAAGMTVVADGIESPQQARILLDMGCELGLGFHFAGPVSPEEIESLWNTGAYLGQR